AGYAKLGEISSSHWEELHLAVPMMPTKPYPRAIKNHMLRNMWQLLKRRVRLEEAEIGLLGRQLAGGLVYIHSLGLAHCDIKQENLMFSDKLELKIGDFGMVEDVLQSEHIRTPGTDGYRAPEMLAGKAHSCKVDIWSVGCVIYQMLVEYDQTSLASTILPTTTVYPRLPRIS
ncbi:Serine/threonine-protein kinase plk1, partial [Linnemannia schmuckeri]